MMRARFDRRTRRVGVLVVTGLLCASLAAIVWAITAAPVASPKNHIRVTRQVRAAASTALTRRQLHRARAATDRLHRVTYRGRLKTALASRAAVSAGDVVPAADPAIDLCAKEGTVTMPDGSSVTTWGFVLKGADPACGDVSPQLPGPVLSINQGDVVTLNVTNALVGHTISIEAPGIDFDPGPTDAAPGDTVSLSFTASSEGTYLYESAGDAGRQEAMGLYGALIVRPTTPNQAYGNAYDVESVLVLSEIDAAFNAAPDTFDMNNWAPKYWLINGKAYPDTPNIDVAAGQRLLLRYANAGVDNNTMTMLGLNQKLIARDAYPLTNPFAVVSETFPSGETADALVTIPATASSGTKFPLYNRNLNLTNGTPGSSNYNPGGMLTFIDVP